MPLDDIHSVSVQPHRCRSFVLRIQPDQLIELHTGLFPAAWTHLRIGRLLYHNYVIVDQGWRAGLRLRYGLRLFWMFQMDVEAMSTHVGADTKSFATNIAPKWSLAWEGRKNHQKMLRYEEVKGQH